MASLNLKALVGKLNTTCRQSLEAAAGLCLSRTHYNVEVEHWLLKLVDQPGTDLAALFRYYEIDVSRLTKDLTNAIDRMRTGNSRPPALSPTTVELAREAFVVGSIEFGSPKTRSGHLLYALLADDTLGGAVEATTRSA